MAFNMAARAAHPKNKTPTDCKWFREDLITYEVGEYNLIASLATSTATRLRS
jgi:hypothetical protein